jgi:hypothetical protein
MDLIDITPAPTGKLQINPDGASVHGCNYIYAPKGQAGEYSELAANPYRGCGHKCAYCYVPLITKQPREEFDQGAIERRDYIRNLIRDGKKYQALDLHGQVMISFTSDPYHPGDTTLTRRSFDVMQRLGLSICALTKGGTRALRDLSIFRPKFDAFASTLTSLDDSFSKKWERGAASPLDRISALREFHRAGIFTWVSLEPTIDVESSLKIVQATHGFVDHFKVGRANYLGEITKTTDWRDYTLRMIDLLQKLGKSHYIKKDLQPYLPAGYHNPQRIAQHH